MISVTRIRSFVKEHSLVVALFALLGIGLLLGDGKQTLVDVYMAAGVLGLYVVVRYFLKKQRDIPSIQGWAWSGLLIYLLIRTAFSDDIGYSIYVFARYVEAFLMYYLFVCYSNKNTTRVFTGALIVFSVFVLIFTVVLALFPYLLSALPQMNLLYTTYGHNHAADLVVFGFSAAAILWAQTKLRRHLALMLLFVAGTMFFFARAVFVFEVILLNGMFLYFFIWKKHVNKTLLIAGPILIIAAIILIVVPYASLRTTSRIFPTFDKQSIWQDQRWEYWRQSIVAIRERPWFGSGPGTFYLQSKLYQKEPNAYSWFAHNFPLEFTTETGLVGLALMIFVVIAITRKSKVKPTRFNVALLVGLCLVLAQSVFDYNLDYVVVWLLVWAIVGAIFSQAVKPDHTVTYSPISVVSVVFIGIFYIMNMFLLSGKNIIKNSPLYIPLCAHDLHCAESLLSQKYSTGKESSITIDKTVQFFHRRNPEIIALLAARYQMTGEIGKSDAAYRDTLTLDPQNNIMFGTYISVLLDDQREDLLLGVIEKMIGTISAHPAHDIGYVRAHWKGISQCFNTSTLLWSKEQLADTYHAKSIYYAGLCLIKKFQFDEARELLRIASDARTSWSNIYLDYAGLSFWRYHDTKAAQQAIGYCKINHNSRQHCTEYDNRPLPQVSVTDTEARFIQ